MKRSEYSNRGDSGKGYQRGWSNLQHRSDGGTLDVDEVLMEEDGVTTALASGVVVDVGLGALLLVAGNYVNIWVATQH